MYVHNKIASILAVFIIMLAVVSLFYRQHQRYDVVVQAGHEGRTKGNTGAQGRFGKENDFNAIVADRVVKRLKQAGLHVKRVGAKLPFLRTRIAVAIHFDGSPKPCSSGASVGYPPHDHHSLKFAQRWKSHYKRFFPFKWHEDNFTENLQAYYGYFWIDAERFLVLELGEITCDQQASWLKPRLTQIGDMIAAVIQKELQHSNATSNTVR